MKTSALILVMSLFFLIGKAQTQRFDVDNSFSGISDIDVSMVFSDIFIEKAEGEQVKVNGYIEWDSNKKYEIKAYKKGSTLVVELENGHKSYSGKASGKLYITMPSSVNAEVSVVSGNINISGVGSDDVECNSVSGDITAEDIGCDIELNSVSGDIKVVAVDGDVESNTVSGDTYISKIKGDFEGNSISGDFTISELSGSRDISTLSGRVR